MLFQPTDDPLRLLGGYRSVWSDKVGVREIERIGMDERINVRDRAAAAQQPGQQNEE